jgi:hypothetical protein
MRRGRSRRGRSEGAESQGANERGRDGGAEAEVVCNENQGG